MSIFKKFGKLATGLASGGLKLLGSVVKSSVGGDVAGTIMDILGVDNEDAALKKLNDPESIVKLRKYEMNNEVQFRQIESTELLARLKDTQNAREADVAKTKVTGKRDGAMYAIAGIVLIGFVAVILSLMRREIPESSESMLLVMLGFLGAAFGQIVTYYFGSSKSSADKTEQLGNGKGKK